jgi:glycerophosphoryl diester phosphodiesterase
MNTKKFNKGNVKVIAHRGVSGLECENTAAAFVAAGNRSYFGIETDMHVTLDGKLIITHDASTKRLSGIDIDVEKSSFSLVENIRLYDKAEGVTRRDLVLPTLEEYLRICKRYEKVAVLELKGPAVESAYIEMLELIRSMEYFDSTIFITFGEENALMVRRLSADAKIQFLTSKFTPELVDWLLENNFDLDIHHLSLTKEIVDLLHSKGIEINCWTVDSAERAEELVEMGIDYITSNILE